MRVLIEIDGDNVTVHRSDAAEPPSELLARATALGAENAGPAPDLGSEPSPEPLEEAAPDAEGGTKPPSGPRRRERRPRPAKQVIARSRK
jgi:hypothetical protein